MTTVSDPTGLTTTSLYRIDCPHPDAPAMEDPDNPKMVQLIEAVNGDVVLNATQAWPRLRVRMCCESDAYLRSSRRAKAAYTLPRDALLLHARLLEVFGDPPCQ